MMKPKRKWVEKMTFFIVHVQTNFEKYVLSHLTNILLQKRVNIVKSIYALDTKIDFIQSFSKEDIRTYLKYTRTRTYLNNLRIVHYQLDLNNHKNQQLKKIYMEQIKKLTQEISQSSKTDKNKFIQGYIIIETIGDFQYIPLDLYHDIKSIPKVVSIPTKYNVPKNEVEFYFEKIEERTAN